MIIGNNHVKIGTFVNFLYIFSGKNFGPPKVDWALMPIAYGPGDSQGSHEAITGGGGARANKVT